MSVIGHPRHGKTTLIKTIRNLRNAVQSNSFLPSAPPEGSDEDLAARTAGVEVQTVELPTGEKFLMSDFAGHLAFLISHHHFLGNEYGIYLALLDAMHALDDMLEEAMFWIMFVLATRPIHYGLPSVLVAFSHGDKCGAGSKDRVQQVLYRLCAHFQGLVHFPQGIKPYFLDCRVWDAEMERLVEDLQEQHSLLRKVRECYQII